MSAMQHRSPKTWHDVSKRRLLGALGIGALLVWGGLTGFGLAGSKSDEADGTVDRQSVAWTGVERTRSARSFSSMVAPGGITIGARGPITVILSTRITGNDADVRVRDGNRTLQPGPARLTPGGTSSVSFVTPGSAGPRCHTLRVEWRSPSEAPATFRGAAVTVLFNRSDVNPPCA